MFFKILTKKFCRDKLSCKCLQALCCLTSHVVGDNEKAACSPDKAHASLVLRYCGIVANATSQGRWLIIALPGIAQCSWPHHWNDGKVGWSDSCKQGAVWYALNCTIPLIPPCQSLCLWVAESSLIDVCLEGEETGHLMDHLLQGYVCICVIINCAFCRSCKVQPVYCLCSLLSLFP